MTFGAISSFTSTSSFKYNPRLPQFSVTITPKDGYKAGTYTTTDDGKVITVNVTSAQETPFLKITPPFDNPAIDISQLLSATTSGGDKLWTVTNEGLFTNTRTYGQIPNVYIKTSVKVPTKITLELYYYLNYPTEDNIRLSAESSESSENSEYVESASMGYNTTFSLSRVLTSDKPWLRIKAMTNSYNFYIKSITLEEL